MADTTTELEVLDEIVDVLGGQSGQYETVVPTLQQIRDLLGGGGGGGGYNPALSVGRADALTGADSTAQWATRESTGSGAATVRSVQGAAVGWNQMLPALTRDNFTPAATMQATFANGVATCVPNASYASLFRDGVSFVGEHKYLQIAEINSPSGYVVGVKYQLNNTVTSYGAFTSGIDTFERVAGIFTPPASSIEGNTNRALIQVDTQTGFTFQVRNWQLFDLTAMFGSGNEPTTVAEFEQMFPEAYYPYSAPTLKPVQIAGIASTDAQGGELDSVEWARYELWGAGTAGDTLYADRIETHMGVVDLGAVRWVTGNTSVSGSYEMISDTLRPYVKIPPTSNVVTNIRCLNYDTRSGADVYLNNRGIAILANGNIAVFDPEYNQQDSLAAFKTAMNGVLLYYELATPTTTPIIPTFDMTYRVEQGGSESIIVPDGEISAAPVLTVAEGESVADVVMDALACIAAPDGPVATANHALNTYLTMGGKLYKVTSAIAVGETIKSGTNVTETTVMAELIARTA